MSGTGNRGSQKGRRHFTAVGAELWRSIASNTRQKAGRGTGGGGGCGRGEGDVGRGQRGGVGGAKRRALWAN